MEPLATYTERLLEVRRQFDLYDDRVVIDARWLLKGRFHHTVPLNTLAPQVREFHIRYRMNRYAGWVLAAGAMVFAMSYYNAKGGPLSIPGYIGLGVLVLGAAFLALTYPNRRIRFARFDAKSGRAGLDISCAGNDPEAFKSFVDAVKQQIRKT
jgi:hypothetical protein